MDWVGWVEKVGIVAALSMVVCSMLFFVLKWMVKQFSEELAGNRRERADYICILDRLTNAINTHNERSKEFQANVTLEHREMISSLGRINGYKHE